MSLKNLRLSINYNHKREVILIINNHIIVELLFYTIWTFGNFFSCYNLLYKINNEYTSIKKNLVFDLTQLPKVFTYKTKF